MSTRFGRFLGIATIALATLSVAACTIIESKPAPPCPKVTVLKEASSITEFVPGPGRDLIDVVYEGNMVDLAGSCDSADVDDDTGEGDLAVELMVTMDLNRGPANKDRKAKVRYFVGITDSERRILNKKDFSGTVEFPGNRSRLQWRDEPIHLNIPLKAGKTGRDFVIFVGFGVTPDQLKFNLQQIEGTRAK